MSCDEKHFSDMIYAYELGLLPEKDRCEFEIHLMECDSCFENLNKFKQEATLLKNDPDVQKSVKQFIKTYDNEAEKSSSNITVIKPRKLWKTFIPVAAAAVLFIFLILKDWQFEIGPSKKAIASENRIAIMYFENLSDPTDSLKIGEIAANLLMTDLAESDYLNIVSSQRLYDLLKLIGNEGLKSINKATATQIASEAKANWILMGNILQIEPNIIITTQLIDAGSGDITASVQVTGNKDDNIFSVIDKLTIRTKENLSLPSDALIEPDPFIADNTTNSSDAYRHYLKGIENRNKLYNNEAIINFETALEYDSTFAMAYYHLAYIKDREMAVMALKYSDAVSTIDRLFIKILETSYNGKYNKQKKLLKELILLYPDEKEGHYQLALLEYSLDNFDVSINSMNNAIKIDPNLKTAYNHLAYAYNHVGDFEKALWAIDKYIELAPDEANPLDTKAEIYALNGMIDNAIESYKRALVVKPDFYSSLKNLSLMYIFNGQYDQADSCLDILLNIESQRAEAFKYKAFISIFQGKLNEALKCFDLDINSQDKDSTSYHFFRSRIFTEQQIWVLALEEIEKAIELYKISNPNNKSTYRYLRILILANMGEMAEAKKGLKELKTYVDEIGNSEYAYWYAAGSIDIVEGNLDKACASFKKSRDYNNEYFVGYKLATTYLLAERYDEAILEFERILNIYGLQRAFFGVFSVKIHYYLGLAYEHSGQRNKAIDQYSIFLKIWKDADKEIKEIEETRNRLVRLQSQS
ncbi:MAG: tetratricopeptide repeat protein [candidate division Zixibacteria bacterium]|nr:tetratricopeptide repeat protein [candidate division Zixibacteria bacterium]